MISKCCHNFPTNEIYPTDMLKSSLMAPDFQHINEVAKTANFDTYLFNMDTHHTNYQHIIIVIYGVLLGLSGAG